MTVPETNSPRGLSKDQWAGIALTLIAGCFLYARHKTLLTNAGTWLQEHHILLASQPHARLQIPYLGGLDAPRLLILLGLIGVALLLARLVRRSKRTQRQNGQG